MDITAVFEVKVSPGDSRSDKTCDKKAIYVLGKVIARGA